MPATYTPVNADASAAAQYTITRLATVSGISGLQNPIDINTTTGGQITAIADSYLGSFGFQTQDVQSGSGTINSTSYVNIFPSMSWTPSVVKTYTVHIDVKIGAQALDGTPICTAFFQLLFNGVATSLTPGLTDRAFISMTSTVPYYDSGWRIPLAFASGANTLQLQCKVSNGSQIVGVGGNAYRAITITG